MKFTIRILLFLAFAGLPAIGATSDSTTNAPEASPPVATLSSPAPQGKVIEGVFDQSHIYPGTTRKYAVYIPAEYNPATPACVYVGQDGLNRKFTSAMDDLIFNKQMPVTVGVFIQSGTLMPPSPDQARRANRCYEYDSLGDTYARFLVDEFLPYIAKTYNLNLSNKGNDRCIGGGSSGGICAFNVAWERPDAFSRVYSISGSYTALRGGDIFPELIRKFDPKPLRVFVHVGTNDMVDTGGSWLLANEEMEQALKFSGYDYQYLTSDGHHMDKYTDIFPQAMTWLWRDWPAPIAAGAGSPLLQGILAPNQPWKLVGEGYQDIRGMTVNPQGEILFCDTPANTIYRISTDQKVTPFLTNARHVNGLTTGADGSLFGISETTGNLVSFKPDGTAHTIAKGLHGHGLVATRQGGFYVTVPGSADEAQSKVWYVNAAGEAKVVDTGLKGATGTTISADGWLLDVADGRSHWVYSYQINPDGTLANREPFHWLQTPDTADDSGADGVAVDQKGLLYAATRMGIQILDLQGHDRCMVSSPYGKITALAFGGPNFDTLYVSCGDKIFARQVKVHGAETFQPPSTARKGGADLEPAKG
jgi:gluconolactonase